MADQGALFTEDINDAIRDVVRALGGNKEVGHRLRPEMPANEAGTWLKDCLNPARRERLNPEQVVWLLREGRKVGCHSAMHFIADEAGYLRPVPMEPKDEAAELQRQYIEAVRLQKRLADRMERVMGMQP